MSRARAFRDRIPLVVRTGSVCGLLALTDGPHAGEKGVARKEGAQKEKGRNPAPSPGSTFDGPLRTDGKSGPIQTVGHKLRYVKSRRKNIFPLRIGRRPPCRRWPASGVLFKNHPRKRRSDLSATTRYIPAIVHRGNRAFRYPSLGCTVRRIEGTGRSNTAAAETFLVLSE